MKNDKNVEEARKQVEKAFPSKHDALAMAREIYIRRMVDEPRPVTNTDAHEAWMNALAAVEVYLLRAQEVEKLWELQKERAVRAKAFLNNEIQDN